VIEAEHSDLAAKRREEIKQQTAREAAEEAQRIEQKRPKTPPEGALLCANLGMRVHPEQPVVLGNDNTGKHPLLKGWKDDATARNDIIRQWAETYPDCNFGIRLDNDNLAVVEVDPYQGGHLRDLRDLVGALGPMSVSGRGIHVFYRGANVPNGYKIGPGLTVRSEGYQVVAPGSMHWTGRRYGRRMYGWDEMHHRPRLEVPNVGNGQAKGQPFQVPETIPAGARHDTLMRTAGSLSLKGLSEAAIVAALRVTLHERGENGPGVRPILDDELQSMARKAVETVDWGNEALSVNLGPAENSPKGKARPRSGSSVTLAAVHETFRRGLHIPDPLILDVPIAAAVANLLDIDPVFLLLVAAGSRGKTEIIGALSGVPEVYPLSSLTKATLLSGHKDPKRPWNHSLLNKLTTTGKRIITFKDFGTILTMHREDRAAVLAQLREVYDGAMVKATGLGEELSWEGHLGFVAGCTPAIDQYYGVIAILGERFVYLRSASDDARMTTGRMALRNRDEAKAQREANQDILTEFVGGLDLTGTLPDFSTEGRDRIVDLADYVTKARTDVARDGYGAREIIALPEYEGLARFAKAIASIGQALMVMGYEEPTTLEVLARLSRDSAPPLRVAVLEWLAEQGGVVKTSDLATALDLPTTTASRLLEDLTALKLVGRTKGGQAVNATNRWEVRQVPTWLSEFTRDVEPLRETAAQPAPYIPPSPPEATSRVNGETSSEFSDEEPEELIPEEVQAIWDSL
jgi:hypothetical protein